MDLDKEQLVNLICKRCDFYKDSDKDLECGAYKILRGLLEKGMITSQDGRRCYLQISGFPCTSLQPEEA